MLEQTKQEKLYDIVQLAREIFIRNVSDFHTLKTLDESTRAANSSILLAELFLLAQEKYASTIQPKSES